jgi:ATP-dependent DNA helicase RecG
MKPSVEKLQKFFKLEAERGYDNRAVLGGLERMLEPWTAEAHADELSDDLIEAIVVRLRDYARLTESSRQEALQGLWSRIQREQELTTPIEPTEVSQTVPAVQEPLQLPSETQESPETPQKPEPEKVLEAEEKVSETSVPPQPDSQEIALNAPITVLSGVGPRYAKTLSRLGLETLGDMLYYFPRRYDDYSQLKAINQLEYGEEVTVIGTVQSANNRRVQQGRINLTEAVVSDGSAPLRVTWFNQPWISKRLRTGNHIVLSGKVEQYLGRMVMNNPELETIDQQNLHTNRIVPVYPLTERITQRWLRRTMYQVVTYWAPRVRDPLPGYLRQSAQLLDLPAALNQVHFPDSWQQLHSARNRLAFDEIFLMQLGLMRQKRTWQERSGRVFDVPDTWLISQVEQLPFKLTNAQVHAIKDLRTDLTSGHPMNRLLQGDVGSGKTVIAALGIAIVIYTGAQSALMAPTSILAEQHYQSLNQLLAGEGKLLSESEIRLMVGATPDSEKDAIRAGLADGSIKVIIGTHALIEDPVIFSDLQLVIVDEQHRFGVEQRATLRQKGNNPHLLVMTATPIPRSLAFTIYGDLDLTIMDEMPPGRQQVGTYILTPPERERAYTLIKNQVAEGHQAFIIYPLVEENEPAVSSDSQSKAAVEEHQRLQQDVFPELNLGLLHGRMRPAEKEEVMSRFRSGEYHILVSTSVVEVGVDVPNATVMLVEGANRFGLAQLHQFRGRVGRGQEKAYCLLIPDTQDSLENERLSAMAETNDGFVLAERDLVQRGPGDFLGSRQSGFLDLRMASLTDVKLIEKARRFAKELFDKDPELSLPEHQQMVTSLKHFWGEDEQSNGGDIS